MWMSCLYCEKDVLSRWFPHGVAWLCDCGEWMIKFSIAGKSIQLQTGNEELAIQYIGKIVQLLEGDKNV